MPRMLLIFVIAASSLCAGQVHAAHTSIETDREVVTAQENAALRYWRVWTYYTDELRDTLREATPVDPEFVIEDGHRALLERESDTIDLLLRAAEMDACDFGIDYEMGPMALMPHLRPMRASYRLLALHGRERLEAGDTDGAVRANAAMYRLVAHLRSDRMLISCLVGTAITSAALDYTEMLTSKCALTEEQGERLCSAIALLPQRDPFGIREGILGEKDSMVGWLKRRADQEDQKLVVELEEAGVAVPEELARMLTVNDRETVSVGIAAMADPFERVYQDFADAWDSDDRMRVLRAIERRVENGSSGPLAKVFAPALTNIAHREAKVVERMHEITRLLGCGG